MSAAATPKAKENKIIGRETKPATLMSNQREQNTMEKVTPELRKSQQLTQLLAGPKSDLLAQICKRSCTIV